MHVNSFISNLVDSKFYSEQIEKTKQNGPIEIPTELISEDLLRIEKSDETQFDKIPDEIRSKIPLNKEDGEFLAEKLSGHVLVETYRSEFLKSDPNLIRKVLASRLIEQIYSTIRIKDSHSVSFNTDILTDGNGDFFNLLYGIKTLKSIYPNWPCKVLYHHSKTLPDVDWEHYGLCEEDVIDLQDRFDYPWEEESQLFLDILNDKLHPLHDKVSRHIQFSKNCHLIVSMPLKLGSQGTLEFYNLVNRAQSCISFSEYGVEINPLNALHAYSTGFGLGLGIYIEQALNLLPSSKDVNSSFEEKYPHLLNESFSLCYSSNEATSLQLIKIMANLDSRKKQLFITKHSSSAVEKIFKNNLEGNTIHKIKAGKYQILLDNNKENKTLIFEDLFPLNHFDFLECVKRSGKLAICTGDTSLSQILAAKKLPIYEIHIHKIFFWNGLIKVAQYCFKEDDTLVKYLSLLKDPKNFDKIENFLKAESIYQQLNELVDFIKKYYNLENHFIGIINKHILTQKSNNLAEFESTLIEEFVQGEISAIEMYNKMSNYLTSIT